MNERYAVPVQGMTVDAPVKEETMKNVIGETNAIARETLMRLNQMYGDLFALMPEVETPDMGGKEDACMMNALLFLRSMVLACNRQAEAIQRMMLG